MKQIIIKSFLFLFLFATTNCGFKVINESEMNKFSIQEIKTSGDKRINFKIKNNLIFNSSQNKENNLILELYTKKTKKIKEKNIKNQITKYEISLSSNIKLNFLEKNKTQTFDIISTGDYKVVDKYATTLTNEKKLIEDLTNDIANKIKNKINLIINDL